MLDLFFAQTAFASFDSFVSKVNQLIINPLIVLMFGVALVVFLFGIFQFIVGSENEQKRTEGRNHMIWGVIGIAIMIGVFSILNLIMSTFGISGINPKEGTVEIPK